MNRRRRHHHGDTSSDIKRVDDNRLSASYCDYGFCIKLEYREYRPVRSLSNKVTLLTGESPQKVQGDDA